MVGDYPVRAFRALVHWDAANFDVCQSGGVATKLAIPTLTRGENYAAHSKPRARFARSGSGRGGSTSQNAEIIGWLIARSILQ
jgi:hypothetical protein